MSLSTGRRLNCYSWTILPMPQEVIDRVHVLARRQHANRGLLFLDRAGNIMPDDQDDDGAEEMDGDNNDSTYAPSNNDSDSDDDDNDDSDDSLDEGNNDVAPIDH